MPTTTAKPSDHDNLLAAIRGQVARVHTSLPGTVDSYDSATQTATVRCSVQFKYADPNTGEVVHYDPPAVSNVPVAFPGAGDFTITWPIAKGDQVLLVFAERSLDEWKSNGAGSSQTAKDVRRFDLSDAIAIPCVRSPKDPIAGEGISDDAMVLQGAEIRLGSSGASDYVALASKVLDELNALRTELLAHTHTTGVGPSGPPSGIGSTSSSVAASKVKAE